MGLWRYRTRKCGRAWIAATGLSWSERRTLVGAWLLLPVTRVGLQVLGFQRIEAMLIPASVSMHKRVDGEKAEAAARLVDIAARWNPFETSCLPRAIVLCRALRQQGLDARLRVGVAMPGGSFAAHAWAEHADIALGQAKGTAECFASFPTPNAEAHLTP